MSAQESPETRLVRSIIESAQRRVASGRDHVVLARSNGLSVPMLEVSASDRATQDRGSINVRRSLFTQALEAIYGGKTLVPEEATTPEVSFRELLVRLDTQRGREGLIGSGLGFHKGFVVGLGQSSKVVVLQYDSWKYEGELWQMASQRTLVPRMGVRAMYAIESNFGRAR